MTFCTAILDEQRPSRREIELEVGNDAEGLGMRDNSGYQSFSTNFKMMLRSGREKPYRVPTYTRQPVRRTLLGRPRSAAAENSDTAWLSLFTSKEPAVRAKTNSKNVVVLMQRLKCNEFVLLSKGENQLCLKVRSSLICNL
ncbi:hypothetical protein CIB84_000675 [Bambusicola thoracicus]|uniref:Uncharacterized protein n=1 Tax=Bambusicola thoracicus TaxID=9083 RepID=A0A2P4TGT4_BAMTH|nr:hypothetical protein CIB84_000675 [Bambusicola thoracicus]